MQAQRESGATSRSHGHIVSWKQYLLESVPTFELGNRTVVFVAIHILTIDEMCDLTLRASFDCRRQQRIRRILVKMRVHREDLHNPRRISSEDHLDESN